MPIAERTQPNPRHAILVALGALAGLLAIVFLVTRLGSLGSGGTEIPIQLGEPVFRPGNVNDLADVIDTEGPILLPDVSGGDRDVVINHLSDDPSEGWVVFAARGLTSPRDCFVEWQPDSSLFVDSCDGSEYPPDGSGLEQYGTSIDDDDNLLINLNIVSAPDR